MNEQLIAQLQLLIELAKTGEEFYTSVYGLKEKVRFFDNKLDVELEKCWIVDEDIESNEFFSSKIIRKPWKPKVGERYFCWYYQNVWEEPYVYGGSRLEPDSWDLHRIAFGNCFRTKEECESHTEIRDKLIAMRKEYE